MPVADLQRKAKTKPELHETMKLGKYHPSGTAQLCVCVCLTCIAGFFLPPEKETKIDFLRDVLSG